jgi:hypothetical protein
VHPELWEALGDLVEEQHRARQSRHARAAAEQAALWYQLLGGSLAGWYRMRGQPAPDWLTPEDQLRPGELDPDWADKLLSRVPKSTD